jgi:protoporphyrinogen/coproporphyrinogen III oxidase
MTSGSIEARPCVAVIGGGISGLAAAFELQSLGVPFTLLESADRCGGVIRTDFVDGYTVDAGPDALLVQKPAAVELCCELGLANRLRPQVARATYVVRRGSLRELPEASVLGIPTSWRPFITTSAFSWVAKMRMAAEVVVPRARTLTDESIASFIGRRFGREAVEYLAEPLLAGIHGGDPTRLSMQSAFPRFLELEARHGSVIAGLRKMRNAGNRTLRRVSSPFVALPRGMRELTDALIARLPPASLHTATAVAKLMRTESGEFSLALDDGRRMAVPAVLLATPPAVTTRLTTKLDSRLAALCGRIRAASVVTIALGYRRAAIRHPLEGTGFVVPRREALRTRALSWVSSKWAERAPDGRVLLRAYVGGIADPSAVDESDQAIIDTVQREISSLLDIADAAEMTHVYRWRDATPQLEVGHKDLMCAIDQRLATMPGLAISASGFRGTGIADCVEDGRQQARRLAERLATCRVVRPAHALVG